MRLIVSTAAFFQRPLREAFRAISDAGFDAVEVMVTRDPLTQEPHVLRGLATEFDLRVEALHAPFLLIARRVFGVDPVEKVQRTVHLAEEVGASVVVAHPPYRWQSGYGRWLVERLPELSARAGIPVAVENMFPLRLRGQRGLKIYSGEGIGGLDGFGDVALDTSHVAVDGLNLLEMPELLGQRLAHVHLSNNAGKGWDSHLPVEQGVLPLAEFLKKLGGNGFGGNVSLELDIRDHVSDPDATREMLVRQREFCLAHLPIGV